MPTLDGLSMKYPSRKGGESYVMPMDIYDREGVENKWDGGRILLRPPSDFVFVDTDSVKIDDNEDVRIYVATSDGYNAASITTNRASLLKNGFMMTSKDWRNVEITFEFVYSGGNDEGYITLGCRGGLQENPCEGFAYTAALKLTGTEGRLSKQQYYPSGNQFDDFTVSKLGTTIKNKTIALKFCVYDTDSSDNPTLSKTAASKIKIELYGAVDGGSFRTLASFHDDGWFNYMDVCGSTGGKHGLWGGPLAFVQWGGDAQIQIEHLSVREIDATTTFTAPTTGGSVNVTTTTPPPTSSTTTVESENDDYGVHKIYQTDPNGTHWYPPAKGMTSYDRFDANGANITNNNDGSYSVKGKSRMLAYVSKLANDRGESYQFPTYNFNELKKRGFWDSSKDFRDIEVTMYVTCNTLTGSADELSIVVRSVRHETSDNSGCGGSSYHGSLRFTDGAARLNKEMWHVNYTGYKTSDKKLGKIIGKKTGLKFICYNSSSTSVKNEVWLDKNADNVWVKYIEFDDVGNWGDDMKHCGALTDGAAILWGSTKLVFKDNGLDIKISKLSIRSITKKLMKDIQSTPGQPTPTTGGGSGQVSRVFSKYIMLYDQILDSTGLTCQGGDTGGGPPPPAVTYTEQTDLTVTNITDDKQMAQNYSSEDDRKGVGWMCCSDSSKMHGKKYKRVQVYLKKKGSPAGNVEVKVLDGNDNTKVSYGTTSASGLGTNYTLKTFTNDNAPDSLPNGIQTNWKIMAYYVGSGSDSSNYVSVGVNYDDPVDSDKTCEVQWEKDGSNYTMQKHSSRDMCGKLFT